MKGHLTQRTKGTWSIVIDVGNDPVTGKRKQRWHTIKGTKRDAERELRHILVSMDNGIYLKPNRLSVGEWLLQWHDNYVLIHDTPSTQESYGYIIRQHLIPALGRVPLTQLRPHQIQDYYAQALKNGRLDGKGGLSPTTVLYHHRILSEAISHAVKMELAVRNVAEATDPPRRSHPKINILNPGDIPKFLEYARETPYYVYFCLLLCTGLRYGEGLALRWGSLDGGMTTISVNETARKMNSGKYNLKDTKTSHSRRMVTMPESLTVLMEQYRLDKQLLWMQCGRELAEADFIFARPDGTLPDHASITRSFSGILQQAGLHHIRIHDLRHTHATLLLKAGVHPKIVSERLGHASVAITLDIYSHVLPGLQEAAAEKFDRILDAEMPVLGEAMPENSEGDVSKMLANGDGVECRPYRSRTCDTLIKSHGVLV